MPSKPPSICGEPGCGVVVPNGGRWCAAHLADNRELRAARDRNALRRESGLKSLYDSSAWRGRAGRGGTRRFILARDPLCQIAILCQGRSPSVDVDHVILAEIYIAQHGGDESFFYDPENLRGACHADHAHKTSLESRGLWNEVKVAAALAAVDVGF